MSRRNYYRRWLLLALCGCFVLLSGCTGGWRLDEYVQRHFRFIRRLRQMRPHSPFLIDGDKVFFLQSDLTLTVLNINTGEVINRDTAVRQFIGKWAGYHDLVVKQWHVAGRLAIGAHEGGVFIVDLDKGAFDLSYASVPGAYIASEPLAWEGGLYFSVDRKLLRLDAETKTATILLEQGPKEFDIRDGRLYGLFRYRMGPDALGCFDPITGEQLWFREAGRDEEWLGFACLDDGVHTFVASAGERKASRSKGLLGGYANRGNPLSRVDVFDSEGNTAATRPAVLSDFGDQWPVVSGSFIYKGEIYQEMRRTEDPDRLDGYDSTRKRQAEEKRQLLGMLLTPANDGDESSAKKRRHETLGGALGSRHISKTVPVGRRGLVGLGEVKVPHPGDGLERDRIVAFQVDDNFEIWKTCLPGMEAVTRGYSFFQNYSNFCSLAVTDAHVLVGMPGGKVECLERETGRPLWLYSFPAFDYRHWSDISPFRFCRATGDGWEEGFYREVREEYEKSLSVPEQLAAMGENEPKATTTRIIVDPAPMPLSQAYAAPVLAWGAIAYILWLLLRDVRPANKERGERAKGGASWGIFVSFAAGFFLGRYSAVFSNTIDFVFWLAVGMRVYYGRVCPKGDSVQSITPPPESPGDA